MSSPREDHELIEATLMGDSAAFGGLVQKYQDRLYHALCQFLGSAEDAADVAQEAFVQAFVKLSTFQRQAQFYTWLYRIARNLAVSRARRRRPSVSLDTLADQRHLEPAGGGPAPGDRLDRQDRVRAVQAALQRLPDEFREVLILREMDDQDYVSIAALLDLPVGTVRSRLHRARLMLRAELTALMAAES